MLMAALWAWGGAAHAAAYRIAYGSGPLYMVVPSLSCADIGNRFTEIQTGVASADTGPSSYFFFDGQCTGKMRVPGDTMTLGYTFFRNSDHSYQASSVVLTFAGVVEDERADDVASMPVQRVLVLLGGGLMLALGVGVGRLR